MQEEEEASSGDESSQDVSANELRPLDFRLASIFREHFACAATVELIGTDE